MFETEVNLALSFRKKIRINTLRSWNWDGMFFYTAIIIWLKSLLLLAALHSPDSAGISPSTTFFGSPPIGSHLMFILFFAAVGLFFKNRMRWWYYLGYNFAVSLMLFCDLVYFRAYGAFLSIRFVLHPTGYNPLDLNLWSYIRPIDFLFLIDFIILFYLSFRKKKVYQHMHRKPVLALSLVILTSAYVGYDHYQIDIKGSKPNMNFFSICWVPYQSMSNMSPIGYHFYDAIRLFGEAKEYKLTQEDEQNIQTWLKQNQEDLPDNKYKGMYKGKNLIMLQVESLEDFVLNQKVNGQEITPNLNRLLKHSLNFTNYYEHVNNGTSSDGDLTTITSTYPIRTGTNFYRYPTNTYKSLPKLFEGIGYHTYSSHPERAGNWNWMEAHHNFGFQTSWDLREFQADERIGLGLSDSSYMRQMNQKLANVPQPFLMHFVTLTSHAPFDIPEKEKGLKLDKDFDETILGAYFQAVNYTDRHIGLFLDRLEKDGLLDNTVVAIYGDHGGVHKFYQSKVDNIKMENEKWRPNTHRLPFLIYSKGSEGETITTIGGQADTMPTLAYLLGVEDKEFKSTIMGKNLLKTTKNYTLLNNGTIVGNPASEEEKNHAKQTFEIADLIHKTNYFKYHPEGF